MRWFWIDRFTVFESGQRAVALKSVSLSEDVVDDYFPGNPILSPSFVLEGFAQAGGLLVGERTAFESRVVLAKITRSKFHFHARPGDTLQYSVDVQLIQPDGGMVKAESHLKDRLQGEAEMTFAYVDSKVMETEFFEPAEFLRMLRIFQLYKVGVDQDGNSLEIPEHLLQAERASLGTLS